MSINHDCALGRLTAHARGIVSADLIADRELLPHPIRIADQVWPDGTIPTVSICCITYNHVSFIREAIEGFLAQETTFPVEILVHDDASSDGTAEIVRDYQAKFPRLIKAVLQTVNQYSQGVKPGVQTRSRAKGEFIAYCEGDDFWTDPRKLQKQVQLLDEHPNAIIAAHNVDGVDTAGNSVAIKGNDLGVNGKQVEFVTGDEVISGRHLPTLSILYRKRDIYVGKKGFRQVTNGDRYLFSMLAVHGGAIISSERMAVYRVHECGVWSGADWISQRRNKIHARIAICLDIEPSHCLPACRHLAEVVWSSIHMGYREHRMVCCREFAPAFVFSLLFCFRSIQAGVGFVPRLIATQLRIAFIPVQFTAKVAINKLKQRLSPGLAGGESSDCGSTRR